MSLSLLPTNSVLINQVAVTVYGVAPGATLLANFEAHAKDNGIDATLNLLLNSAGLGTDANFNAIVLNNLGLSGEASAVAYMDSSVAASGRLATMKAAFDFLGSVAGQDNAYGTAGAAFNSKVTKSIEYSSVATNTSASADAVSAAAIATGSTFTLTTGADSGTAFGGSINNDTFNAVIGTDATTANGTTLNPGDNLSGGTGADTLNVSVAGTHTAAQTVSAVTLAGIESVMVSNFQTADNFDTTIDLSLADDVTTLGVSSSAASGDTLFTGVKALAAAEMKFGAGDLSVTYADTAVSGSADTQTLALEGVTAGTFTAAAASTGGVETLAITSSGTARNVLTGITDATTLKTISVAGTQAATLGTLGASVTSVNASGNSGGVTLTTGNATAAVTGSTGADAISVTAALTTGSVDAGDGTDSLVLVDSIANGGAAVADTIIASATNGAKFTNFETLNISHTDAGDAATVAAYDNRSQDVSLVSGITTVGLTTYALTGTANDDSDTATTVTLSNLGADVGNLNISGLSLTDGTDANDDDVTLTLTASLAANTAADELTVTLGTSTAAAGNALTGTAATDGLALEATLDQFETLNLVSQGGANAINTLNAAALTTLTASGSKNLTIEALAGNTATTSIDASSMTGAFIMGTNAGTTASTIAGGSGADTLTGGTKADTMSGNAGADSITGAAGNDVIDGGAGADTIVGGAGIDNLTGGAGADVFLVSTAANFTGLASAEVVSGGEGSDKLQFAAASAPTIAAADLASISSIEKIEALATTQNFNVTLTDAVYTANGNTSMTVDATTMTTGNLTVAASALTAANSVTVEYENAGATTDSSIVLGAGADTVKLDIANLDDAVTVTGGAGTDTLTIADAGTTGSATLASTITGFEVVNFSEDDGFALTTVDANVAADATLTVDGTALTTSNALTFDASADTNSKFVMTGGSGADSLSGGAKADTIDGGAGVDTITGGAGIDSLTGGAGADRFVVGTAAHFVGLDSAEAVVGGSGDDTLAIAVGSANITVGSTDLLGLSSIKTIDIDNVNSQTASITLTDAVYTANGATTLAVTNSGTGTDDGITVTASALSSANSLQFTGASATAANENVVGGAGDDTFTFSTAGVATGYDANDTVNGGAGTDTLVISTGTTALTAATLTNVSNIEAITVSGTTGGVGTLTLVDGNFVSITGATVSASALTTGALLFTAAAEDDSTFNITGGAGADNIVGGQLADTISGGSGADTITGGLKADVLSGGAGADTFVFATTTQSSGSNADSISDFVSGSDKLNVTLDYSGINSGLTVDATVQTARAGTALIQENLSGARGQATYDTTDSALYVNVNSDNLLTTSDYKIAINPASTATATIAEGDLNFVITGGAGADTITAGGGADTITAGAGADVITGGAGDDTITLGTGAAAGTDVDIVKFGASGALNGSDTINEFAVGSDKFDVTAFLTGATAVSATESEPTDLATEGVSIAVATNKILFASAHATATTSFDSVADIVTGLADGGAFDAVDVAASAKALLFFGAAGTATQMFVYAVENDATAAVTADELTLIATVNGAADDVGNLAIGTNFVVS